MTALLRERQGSFERWTYHLFPLASGNKAWRGGMAGIDLSTGKVEPMHAEADLFYIGTFAENMDATSAEKFVQVNLGMEIEVRWWANDSGSPVAADDVGQLCYAADDQTVSMDGTGRPVAGRVWLVDTSQGVAVQKLEAIPPAQSSLGGLLPPLTALPAFSSNAIALDDVESGTHYDVPATAAASTITLPNDAEEGTILEFSADGVKNGHTVTYRDETGPTAITTALTASKRHFVRLAFIDGTWRANAYVSP